MRSPIAPALPHELRRNATEGDETGAMTGARKLDPRSCRVLGRAELELPLNYDAMNRPRPERLIEAEQRKAWP